MSNPYAVQQLARAFHTAGTHEDEGTRRRADERAAAWTRALQEIDRGGVSVGSRTPVAGPPAGTPG